MRVSAKRCGRLPVLVAVCALLLGAATSGNALSVQIDLDRYTDGIQSTLVSSATGVVGSVVVTGVAGEENFGLSTQVTTMLVARSTSGDSIDTANSTVTTGEADSGTVSVKLYGKKVYVQNLVTTVPPKVLFGSKANLQLSIINFDLALLSPVEGETFTFSFLSNEDDDNMGVSYGDSTVKPFSSSFYGYPPIGLNADEEMVASGATLTIGGGEEPTATPTDTVVIGPTATPTDTLVPPTPTNTFTEEPTATPTDTPSICADAGYYVMTSFGQHIRVGNPEVVTGTTSGEPVFVDMEVVDQTPASSGNIDLAVLDQTGVVKFIETPGTEPAQDFVLSATSTDFPGGYAVDFQMSSDAKAFWVLTEGGAIYRAGNANVGGTSVTAQLGNDAATLTTMLPIPFDAAMRNTHIGSLTDGSSIRAVAFAVIETTDKVDNANPQGFIVLDSQGGSYLFDGAGNSIRMGGAAGTVDGEVILNRSTIYPFFPGLDIGRDIDLHPLGTAAAGLVIYDGWGGVHVVPNDVESPVRFMRNETAIGSGVNITTVGLPYLIMAFDDPTTTADESASSADVNSIFTDFEFCQDGETDGAYIMDKFGGIFAFGSTRASVDSTTPRFSNSPYFYPFMWAQDMEPVLRSAVVTVE